MIVAENISLIWNFFAVFCQASSGHSDSTNRPGYEAGLSRRGKLKRQERNLCRLRTSFSSRMRSRFLNNQ